MALRKRVDLIGTGDASLRMSLDGYDVDTATLDQMAFDARFANMERYMEGFAVAPYLGNSNTTSATVYFGRTFSTPPIVLAMWQFGNPAATDATSKYYKYYSRNFWARWEKSGDYSADYYRLYVGLSSMTFTALNSYNVYHFKYIVFKPEI